jgi:hypothetical protein
MQAWKRHVLIPENVIIRYGGHLMGESETPGKDAASEAEPKSGSESEQAESAPPGTGGTSPEDPQTDIKYQG